MLACCCLCAGVQHRGPIAASFSSPPNYHHCKRAQKHKKHAADKGWHSLETSCCTRCRHQPACLLGRHTRTHSSTPTASSRGAYCLPPQTTTQGCCVRAGWVRSRHHHHHRPATCLAGPLPLCMITRPQSAPTTIGTKTSRRNNRTTSFAAVCIHGGCRTYTHRLCPERDRQSLLGGVALCVCACPANPVFLRHHHGSRDIKTVTHTPPTYNTRSRGAGQLAATPTLAV